MAEVAIVAYQTDNQTSVTRRVRRRSVVAPSTPEPISISRPHRDLATQPETSRHTTLVFQVLLASAVCLTVVGALAGVGSSPQTIPNSSPDAAPPAVFIQTD